MNGDYILREDALYMATVHEDCGEPIMELIEKIPAADVEPKRKTGRWTEENVYFDAYAWRCSVCKEDWDLIEGTPFENNMRFCPKCGAEMIAEVPKGEEDERC